MVTSMNARIGPAPRSRAAAMVLGLTADRPMSDTMIAKGRVQTRCPSVTVTQDGLTRTCLRTTDSPRPSIVPGTNIVDRMTRRNMLRMRVITR